MTISKLIFAQKTTMNEKQKQKIKTERRWQHAVIKTLIHLCRLQFCSTIPNDTLMVTAVWLCHLHNTIASKLNCRSIRRHEENQWIWCHPHWIEKSKKHFSSVVFDAREVRVCVSVWGHCNYVKFQSANDRMLMLMFKHCEKSIILFFFFSSSVDASNGTCNGCVLIDAEVSEVKQ